MIEKKIRKSVIKRVTNETDVNIEFLIDGTGESNIDTGIGFLDHMFTLFSRHGLFDIVIKAVGDLHIDAHHTVEDIGIVLGKAIKEAVGEKKSIKRYGHSLLPMDETLVLLAIDLSGRPYLAYDVNFPNQMAGGMETQLFQEFFRAVAINAEMNLHIKVLYGQNTHHMLEAIFKAFARALDEATRYDDRIEGVMSTKGTI
jgi:imidazoleglycerol-phosphate dehydratase